MNFGAAEMFRAKLKRGKFPRSREDEGGKSLMYFSEHKVLTVQNIRFHKIFRRCLLVVVTHTF